jgi:hypothetical protein
VADSYVDESSPTRNFGNSTALRTDAVPIKNVYLRFDVQVVGAIESATLRIFVETSNPIGADVRGSDNTWQELTVTFDTQPPVGAIIGSSGPITGGDWYSFDVSAWVSGNGPVSFAWTSTSTTATRSSSREGTSPPELIITTTPSPLPAGSFSFTAAGDHGGTSATSASLQAIASDPSILFHLAVGDLSYGDLTPESAWCAYVKNIVGSTFPFELITGNHEDSPSSDEGFIDNFADCLPDRVGSVGSYGHRFYFDYPAGAPTARLILIDADVRRNGARQTYCGGDTANCDWLKSAIGSAKAQGLWTIVGMHKVCISAGNKSCTIGEALMNVLIEEGVDLVLQAHDHNYQRSHSLAQGPSCTLVPAGSFDADCIGDDGSDGRYAKGAGTLFVIAGSFGRGPNSIDTADPELGYFTAWNGSNVTNPDGFSPARGFVKYTVTADRIEGTFVPTSRGDYTDSFVIQ